MERTEKKFTPLQLGKMTGKAVLRLLYPPRCILCDTILAKGEEGCCRACAKNFRRWKDKPAFNAGSLSEAGRRSTAMTVYAPDTGSIRGQQPSFIPVPCDAPFIG
ncbi:MAG: double zinc ribbon domain-containing protein [Lachnospiraceae bacterium]